MKIKSLYRKLLLGIIGNYKELPATKNGIEMLIKAYPELQDRERLIKTYQKMQELNLTKKIALFKTERHSKDTIEITQKGIDVLKENGIDVEKKKESLYETNTNIETKQFQYKTAETDIFFKGAGEKKFFTRNTLIDFLKRQGTWEIARQFRGARINGILNLENKVLPVYNIKDRNMKVNLKTENAFLLNIATALKKKTTKDKVLLADSEEIIDKTVLGFKGTVFRLTNGSQLGGIYNERDYETKSYLLLNKTEQQELVEFFSYGNIDEMIINHLIEMNLDKIYEDKNEEGNISDTYFGNLAIYEISKEVGISIIRQELNEISRLYRLICSTEDKLKNENRKLIIYGLPCNKVLYKKIFAAFSFTEFKEIEKEDLMQSIKLQIDIYNKGT